MKKLLAATTLATLMGASGAMAANTNYMIGATWSIGGNAPEMGVSARVLLSDPGSKLAAGAGVTYYVSSGNIGYDAIAAYMQNNIVLGGGYDFGNYAPVFTLGYFQ